MAEPNSKRPPIRRRISPITRQQIVAQPDAINETLRADGTLQRIEFQKRQVEEKQRREQNEQKARSFQRANYRTRMKAQREQARQNGQVNPVEFPVELMSDAAIDAAIEKERRDAEFMARQPQIGPANPVWSYPAETRRALGYYTNEEREQAAKLNDMRSSTFLGNVMPNFGRQAAYNNPGAEMDAFRQTALYMPNAALAGSSMGLPSASTAIAGGLRQGWQTAGNVGTRMLNATTQGAKAAVPVVTNPRWAATAATVTVPTVADAAVTAGDGGGSSDSYAPAILGTLATLGLGYGTYKGYGTLKRAGWNLKALKPGAEGAAIRAAARNPQATSTALIPYRGVYERPGFFESWWETPKKSAAAAGLPAPSKGQIWGARGRNYLRATGYGIGAGTLLDLGMSGASGEPFQWKAGRLPIALPESVAKGGYNALKGWYYPSGRQDTTQATDSVATQSKQVANPTDTIVPVPRFEEVPVTTSTQAELDSINNAWFNGEPIK